MKRGILQRDWTPAVKNISQFDVLLSESEFVEFSRKKALIFFNSLKALFVVWPHRFSFSAWSSLKFKLNFLVSTIFIGARISHGRQYFSQVIKFHVLAHHFRYKHHVTKVEHFPQKIFLVIYVNIEDVFNFRTITFVRRWWRSSVFWLLSMSFYKLINVFDDEWNFNCKGGLSLLPSQEKLWAQNICAIAMQNYEIHSQLHHLTTLMSLNSFMVSLTLH